MATDTKEYCEISAKQLFEQTKSRPIITCSLSLDIGLGGGIPLGATVLFGGKPKVGKSTTVLQYAANGQKQYDAQVFIYPIEGRLTHQTLNQVKGFDMDKVIIVLPPEIKDKKDKVVGYKKWFAQQWWDALGNRIKEYPKSIHVFDSLSALSSEREQAGGMGWEGRGDLQKLEAQFCRSFGDLIIANQVTVFFITQVQANTSGYGVGLQLKAGNAIRHQADIVIFGKNIEKWKEKDGRILGHDINYTIETSALGPPHIDVSVPLRYGWGLDNQFDIVRSCITWGLINRGGSWYSIPFKDKNNKIQYIEEPNFEDKELIRLQGELEVRNWLVLHDKECKLLEKTLRNKVML